MESLKLCSFSVFLFHSTNLLVLLEVLQVSCRQVEHLVETPKVAVLDPGSIDIGLLLKLFVDQLVLDLLVDLNAIVEK